MKLKKLMVIALTAVFGVLYATSCHNDEEPIAVTNITVNPEVLDVDSTAGDYTVTLKSNMKWTADVAVNNPWGDEVENFEKNPWLSVSQVEGSAMSDKDSVVITLKVKQNESDTVVYDRSAVVFFRAESGIFATVTVNQLGREKKPNAGGPEYVTIEEFLALPESDKYYLLAGKIENIANTTYGNFNITDNTGSVYVYGLTKEKVVSNDKSFSDLGLSEGDVLVIAGTRGSYQGTPQVTGPAYYAVVSVEDFLAREESDEYLCLAGTVANLSNTTYGNFDLVDKTGKVYVYGLTKEKVTSNDKSFGELGIKEGDQLVLSGTRSAYQGTPQVGGPAFYMYHTGAAGPKVTVSDAVLSDDKTSAEITAEYSSVEEGAEVAEAGVVYGVQGSEETVTVKAAKVESPFTVTLTELAENTIYDYHAYIKIGEDEYVSETKSINTSSVLPSETLTVAEFLAKEAGNVRYQLEGVVASIANADYGNFTLKDATGEVFVYGLTATPVEKNDKSFNTLGVKEGDVVTLVGVRADFEKDGTKTPQVGSSSTVPAYYVSHAPLKTVEEFMALESNKEDYYTLKGQIINITSPDYGNFVFKDATGEIDVRGLTATKNVGQNDKSFATLGLKEGDIVTMVGIRNEFNGTAQVGDNKQPAYYILHEEGTIIGVNLKRDKVKYDDPTTVTVTGTYTYEGESTITEVGAGYKAGGTDGEYTFVKAATVESPMSITFTDLTTDQEYEYVLYAKVDGKEYRSDAGTFTPFSYEAVDTLTVAAFLAKDVNSTVRHALKGKVTNLTNATYGNFDLEDETGKVYVYGLTATRQPSNDKSFASLGLKEGDILTLVGTRAEYNGTAQVGGPAYYVKHEEGTTPEPETPVLQGTDGDGVYTSNVTLTANTSTKAEKCVIKIGEDPYDGLKLGTSKAVGSAALKPDKEGDYTLTLYAIAWKGAQTNVSVTISGGGTIDGNESVELALKANDGLTSSTPFTITVGADFYTIPIKGASVETVITITTENMKGKRIAFWGVNAN